jgi:hypothetical protein
MMVPVRTGMDGRPKNTGICGHHHADDNHRPAMIMMMGQERCVDMECPTRPKARETSMSNYQSINLSINHFSQFSLIKTIYFLNNQLNQ